MADHHTDTCRNMLCSLVLINVAHITKQKRVFTILRWYCRWSLKISLKTFLNIYIFFHNLYLHNFEIYKYLAKTLAFVKFAPLPYTPNQDWTNIPSVFIAGHWGHSNWETKLQMLFPLPKLIANKCSFCQKGEKSVKPSGKSLSVFGASFWQPR